MSTHFQTIAALIVVGVTLALLIFGAVRKRKKPGCGGDCGCPTDEFKAKVAKAKLKD